MTPALLRAVASWRKQAIAIVCNPDSTVSQIALAWKFLHQHGAR